MVQTLAVLLLGSFGLLHGVQAPAQSRPAPEHEVKAAYLLNFTRFVDWPPDALAGERFLFCIIGHDPFDGVLPTVLEGEAWNGKPFATRAVRTATDVRGCQVLFVARTETHRLDELRPALAKGGILTVGESPEFLRQGGIINLVLDHSKLRFEVNTQAAERSRLRISSRLLRLARNVRDPQGSY